jgi:beta-barrel assembly-enhancing protease
LDSEATGGRDRRPGYWDGPARFYDGNSAKPHEVHLVLHPDGLEIAGAEAFAASGAGGFFLPAELKLLEKHGRDFLQLELRRLPGSMLEIHDAHAVRFIELLWSAHKRPFLGMTLAAKAWSLAAFLILALNFMYFIGLDLAVEGSLAVIPRRLDRVLGDAVVATLETKTLTPKDSLAANALRSSVEAIRAMSEADANPAEWGGGDSLRILIVADTSMKNAFAFPGGAIVVYTGMLRMLDDQEEWLGLLAHESGHVKLRHGMRGIVRGSILGIGMSLVFGDLSGISAVIMDNAGSLMKLKYGRDDEAAADAFARERMAAAGYPPAALARLFRKFLALEKQPKWAAFMSTHPATEERIAGLEAPLGPEITGHAKQAAGQNAKQSARHNQAGHAGKRHVLTREEWDALQKL